MKTKPKAKTKKTKKTVKDTKKSPVNRKSIKVSGSCDYEWELVSFRDLM